MQNTLETTNKATVYEGSAPLAVLCVIQSFQQLYEVDTITPHLTCAGHGAGLSGKGF